MKRLIWVFIVLLFFFLSCKKNKKVNKDKLQIKTIIAILQIETDKNVVVKGQDLKVNFYTEEDIDSVEFFVNDSLIFSTKQREIKFDFNTKYLNNFGLNYLFAKVYKQEKVYSFSDRFVLFPKQAPKWYTYKIIETYPHDPNAYTQGLVYEDNILYESTGLKGVSSIRKVDLKTGKIIQSFNVDPSIFGEGLTIFGDSLIHLSWQSRRGFVYKKYNLQKLGEFYYETQGWGLTNDNKNLIMSDGTNRLYVLDPYDFVVVKQIEVYDNKGPVAMLNELEFIDGKIYANIYMKDLIAIIDYKSGRVEAYLDLTGLLKPSERSQKTDVLNGIAYDKDQKRLLLTGKNWPKVFWIELIPKN